MTHGAWGRRLMSILFGVPETYWFRGKDGTASIVVRRPVSRTGGASLAEREAVNRVGEVVGVVAKECGSRVLKTSAFLSNGGGACEMVGTADVEYRPGMTVVMDRLHVAEAK